MGLSFPFLKKKPEKTYYFCLYMTDMFLEGFVLDTDAGRPIVISQKRNPLTAKFEKILEDTDTLISDLELQAKVSLNKTIFFLHTYMIDPSSHEIKDPYKDLIKNIVKELELEPLGYIDVQESINDYVKNKSIINSIFVEFNKTELGIFIYKGGLLVHYEYTPLTENIGNDIEQVLINLPGQTILPTKLLLYGANANTEVASQIASYKWKEKTFIQHPSINVLKDEEMNEILGDSFAKELTLQADTQPVEKVEAEEATHDNFGFMMGSDISGEERPVSQTSAGKNGNTQQMQLMSMITNAKNNIIHIFSSRKVTKAAKLNKTALVAGSVVIGLMGAFVAYEYFFHKVTLQVYMESKDVSKEIELELPITESSSGDLTLLKHVKVVDYTQEKNTTGSRDVGQKAKGEVVIHNFDNSEKTVGRGTTLTYKELKFTIDNEVKVASSGGITSEGTKQSGKAKVSVTAEDIGSEYNIDKGSQLKVGDLSESLFLAIVDSAFTGGTKKKVNTVSKDDIEALEKTAEKEAKKKSGEILGSNVSKDDVVIAELSDVVLSETTYSKELGEEADKLGIEASAEIQYYTINKTNLKKDMIEQLKEEEVDNYVLDPETVIFKVAKATKDDEEAALEIDAEAKLYKKVEVSQLKKAVKFKSLATVTDVLQSSFNTEDVTIEQVTPAIPFINGWVPLFSKNIEIITSSK